MFKLIAATALPAHKLRVEYADGVTGEVDLSHLVGKGVFSAWNDPTAFETVTIGSHGELLWSDEIDLCPDAIYLEITGKSAEEVFPSLREPTDA